MKRNSKGRNVKREKSSSAEKLFRLIFFEPNLRAMDKLLSYACVKGLRGIYILRIYVQIGWYREFAFVPYKTKAFLFALNFIY
jgi:hypothetical protein